MLRLLFSSVIAVALVGIGWVTAKAQPSVPDFELRVDAPAGASTITCVRGCTLVFAERGINPNETPRPSFQFSCSGAGAVRCASGKVGGWITH